MVQKTERSVLRHLIETCRDAERGFRTAADEVKEPELKRLFLRLAEQRRRFAGTLLPFAQQLGGPPAGDGTTAGALHRAWMRLKATVAGNPDRAVLEEAARGERVALAAYDEAVNDLVPPAVRDVIEAQDFSVRVARRLVGERAARRVFDRRR
jgi:uncharacterized protein (TIGR02284 family)